MEDKECVDCGEPMVIRTNRNDYNDFWGCSTYPDCKYTEKIEEEKEEGFD